MKKEKRYSDTRFSADTLRDAWSVMSDVASRASVELNSSVMSVDHPDCRWSFNTVEEFLADFRRFQGEATFIKWGRDYMLSASFYDRSVLVSVSAPTRPEIERVFEVFERCAAESRLPALILPPAPMPTVFIGHGRDRAWRDLKDHLHDKHQIVIESYETGARAGHTIRDILRQMVSKSSFAILVMTGEDTQSDGATRARQNVIHEAGLFQGSLGFSRAILLIEEGVEEFSNVDGVQSIRFSKGRIKETFGDIVATIFREFPR